MGIADELKELAALRERGVLTEDEFARAKATLLAGTPTRATVPPRDGAAPPATPATTPTWVVVSIVGGILALLGLVTWLGYREFRSIFDRAFQEVLPKRADGVDPRPAPTPPDAPPPR